MKENIFVSGITLMAMFLTIGCGNNINQSSTNNEAKSSKTSHKENHKAKKHTTKRDKIDVDTDDSETTNSGKKNDKSSESSSDTNDKKTNKNESTNSNNSSDPTDSNNSNNVSNLAASNNQTNGESQDASSANNTPDAVFSKMASDTTKGHGHSSSCGPDNFTLIDGSGDRYSLAEKSTGTIVDHYSVKSGGLYKQDIFTGNDVRVK